jgi:hypothetical protein
MGFNNFLDKQILHESSIGLTHDGRTGATIKANTKNVESKNVFGDGVYTLVSNSFEPNIQQKLTELKDAGFTIIITPGRKLFESGYVFVLEGVENGNFAIVYYAKTPLKLLTPSKIGMSWAVSAESADLKPQSFNIKTEEAGEDFWYTMSEFYEHMLIEIPKRTDLNKSLRDYLIALLEYFIFKDEETKTMLNEFEIKDFPTSQIQKNFGEIIGPFFVVDSLDYSDKSEINFPTQGNNSLVDYKIKITNKDGKIEMFSAKSGGKSNLIKPETLMDIVKELPNMKNKVNRFNKNEYLVLFHLNNNTANNGPIYAAFELNKKHKNIEHPLMHVNDKFVESWKNSSETSWVYDQSVYSNFVNQNYKMIQEIVKNSNSKKINVDKPGYPLDAKKPSYGVIRYTIEKILQTMSDDELNAFMPIKLDFNDLFVELSKKVRYIYLSSIKNGIPQFKHFQAKPGSKDIILRSKNSVWKAGDKMGITPDKSNT